MTRYVCTRITITGDRYTIKTTNPKELESWAFRSLGLGSTSLIEVRAEEVEVIRSRRDESVGQQRLNVGVDRLPCPRCGLGQCPCAGYVPECVRTGQ